MTDVHSALSGLRIIYGGMMASLVGVSAVAVLFRTVIEPHFDSGMQNLLLGVAGLMAVVGPGAYFAIQRQAWAELKPKAAAIRASAEPLRDVLEPYRRLAVLRAALIEGPGMIGAISYLAGGPPAALFFPAASAVLLILTLPSHESLRALADRSWE
jgi:hypothetical protein